MKRYLRKFLPHRPPGGQNRVTSPLAEAFPKVFRQTFGKGVTDMDIREERYLDYIAMLLISILLIGLTLLELAVVLSRNIHG